MTAINSNTADQRETNLIRELSPLLAKLYELDPARASADTNKIIKTLQAAG